MARARIPEDEGVKAVAAIVVSLILIEEAANEKRQEKTSSSSSAFGLPAKSATSEVFDSLSAPSEPARARKGSGPLATAVRYLLQLLADKAPGHTLEVRVPPYGAVQCVEGPRHTRGTPPNVIEMEAQVWVALATGLLSWDQATKEALVQASGTRAELRGLVPVVPRGLRMALLRGTSRDLFDT